MIDVEEQCFFRKLAFELFESPLLPAIGQIFLGIQILGEKTLFVRNFEKVQHGDNHPHVRDEDRLCEFRSQLFVAFLQPRPEAHRGPVQSLRVQLVEVKTELQPLKELKSLQASERDRTQ